MQIDCASSHRPELERIIAEHSPYPAQLHFVADIQSWATDTGARVRGNPSATCLSSSSPGLPWLIVLRENIDESQIKSILDVMEIYENRKGIQEQLGSPERFLEHTVLHELAHLVLDCGNEGESRCNDWAFARLT